jgi:glutamyl-Q tRNA(Asp) synthetase
MRNLSQHVVGRFAPSPTGQLHVGSLATAVGSYLMAKQSGGRWLIRLDDLDRQRQVPGCADDILRTLELFGLLWDGEIARQSSNLADYEAAFVQLQESGALYPCGCSRKDLAESSSAPHGEEGVIYPSLCRNGMKEGAQLRSWRVRVPEGEICFEDGRKGVVCQMLPEVCGDFVVRRGDCEFAYQLAVVVDDALAGVNQVVRGDDLLLSTPRQLYLQNLLGIPHPAYCHLPLVTGPGGGKLSKRDHLVSYQAAALSGREDALLLAILSFLGQKPPAELAGSSCAEILVWAVRNFSPHTIPATGGTLS